ncbi:ATP-binding protein [uncultured Planktosalinus sp.]|uniref:sensor histidine kinase n=1 Tax=uncultured Planktosalinus sp. TaxID=1810935 RepID=UPI0030DCC29C
MLKGIRSLRTKIFLAMILLVLGATILIATATIYQYSEDALEYHKERLERKEDQIKANINYELRKTSYEVITQNIPLIFKDKIYEIQDIHNMQLSLFDLEGKMLKSSNVSFFEKPSDSIPKEILTKLKNSPSKKYTVRFKLGDKKFRSSYSYITDNYFKPLAILNLPYIEEDDFISRELKSFLIRLAQVYVFLMIIAIVLSYFLSKHITKSLNTISEKIKKTRLETVNKRIQIENVSEEISTLVNAYNDMIDELEKSAAALAATERESAWREMAKQVAHEIKNPLTPMRLTVQSFERKFNNSDPDNPKKVKEFAQTLTQQIDTMSSIASAFSTYANMPAQKDETLNLIKISKLALDIFNEDFIEFNSKEEKITVKLDRAQLIRVVTNLVKNAIHSVEEVKEPKVKVTVFTEQNKAIIEVYDNGVGIPAVNLERIFEPKFTTKSSGMGLGLAMVKSIIENYGGKITLHSEVGKGSVFRVEFPKFNN